MRFLFLLSFLLTGISVGFSQTATANLENKNLLELREMAQEVPSRPLRLAIFPLIRSAWSKPKGPKQALDMRHNATPLPAAWRYEDLALFCKIEVKMEKALQLPVKFRLGEVQYVERMEGKLQTGISRRQ